MTPWDRSTERIANMFVGPGHSIPLALMVKLVAVLALREVSVDGRIPARYHPLRDLIGVDSSLHESLCQHFRASLDEFQRWLCGSAGIAIPPETPPEPSTVWDRLDDQ